MLIVSKGRVWRRFSDEWFDGYAPEPTVPNGQEYMHWKGGRISLALWQTILCFFLEHKNGEVQVRLYYNTDTRQWGAHAFPQRWPTGMTTRELDEHANFREDLALFPAPWAYMGTVHHHCQASAFQSGTDHSNETGIVGLHITVGKLGDSVLDLHGRVCVKFPGEMDAAGNVVRPGVQQFYEAPAWSNWFELPAPVTAILPRVMHESILTTLLKTPVEKEVGFPARWAENLIRFCHEPASFQGNQGYCYQQQFDTPAGGYHAAGIDRSSRSLPALQRRSHLAPRGSQKSSEAAGSVQKTGQRNSLPDADAIGMRPDEHEWLLKTVLALMDPVFPHGSAGAPVGQHLDLEQAWPFLEVSSLVDARNVIEKMGFVVTRIGTYCHPEELSQLNREFQDDIDRETKERNNVTTIIPAVTT